MVNELTVDNFKQKVFDYTVNESWNYNGTIPSVIKFGTEWCNPCKVIAPILEELSETYDGKVDFYTVDVDKEQELAQVFGIRSVPTLLFVPKVGEPQMAMGALPKNELNTAINDILLVPVE